MGWIGDCFDNSVAESFFGTLQLKLYGKHRRGTRRRVALVVCDWMEAWSSPRGRHFLLRHVRPTDDATASAS